MVHMNPHFAGLEWLATAVLALDEQRCVRYINPAAENLLALSGVQVKGLPLSDIFRQSSQLYAALDYAVANNASFT